MPRAYSGDLHRRIVADADKGLSIGAVADKYSVSPSFVSKITCLWRQEGSVSPRRIGGYRRHALQAHACPALKPGDIVVCDNLGSHKVAGVRETIEDKGARIPYLPPCSPDLNPIEQAFSKIKTLLRKAAERSFDALWAAIGRIVETIRPRECRNYFANSWYTSN